jgi:hypothetical protein
MEDIQQVVQTLDYIALDERFRTVPTGATSFLQAEFVVTPS